MNEQVNESVFQQEVRVLLLFLLERAVQTPSVSEERLDCQLPCDEPQNLRKALETGTIAYSFSCQGHLTQLEVQVNE